MQAMATPITTTAVPQGETGLIQAVSGPPEAPFDAVLALLAPASAGSADGAADPAIMAGVLPVCTPVEGLTAIAPDSAAGDGLTAPLQAAALPVSPALVNTADAADGDVAALLAATAMAGRGISARAPAPAASPAPDIAACAARPDENPALPIPPEDFIGPILPADRAAAPVIEAHPADEDFVGPVLPPELRPKAAVDVDPLDLDAAETIDVSAIHPAPAGSAIRPAPVPAAAPPSRLPEAEALLQPEGEVQEFEQPTLLMTSPVLAPGQADPGPQRSVDMDGSAREPAGVSASAQAADDAAMVVVPARSALRDALRADVTSQSRVTTFAAPVETGDGEGDLDIDPGDADLVESSDVTEAAHDTASADAGRVADAMAVQAALIAAAVSAPRRDQPAPQPVEAQDRSGHADEILLPRNPPPALASQPSISPMPPRDLAILRMLNGEISEKPVAKAEPRATEKFVRPVQAGESADPIALSAVPPTAQDETSAPVLRPRTVLDHLDRDLPQRTDGAPIVEEGARSGIDPQIASMVHSLSIVQSGSVTPQEPAALPLMPLPAAPVATADNVTRDAPVVSSIAADGRRDTQRDAEIRERQIKQQVTLALRAGSQEVRMQLYPPGLGQIMIRIALDGPKLRLSMKADNADAADALTQAEGGLRDALSRDGFSLAGFDVHEDERRGGNRRQEPQPQNIVSNRGAGEGDAFSVDMTA